MVTAWLYQCFSHIVKNMSFMLNYAARVDPAYLFYFITSVLCVLSEKKLSLSAGPLRAPAAEADRALMDRRRPSLSTVLLHKYSDEMNNSSDRVPNRVCAGGVTSGRSPAGAFSCNGGGRGATAALHET
ncbi:hypothetical protein EVAR_57083_1 [Eumeta japonica]|uniref:Uncharacterized protein n=1 Tax=Eumeta variegata TaxID=151549 RepID=A0A4C1Z972_EUMVA|nr:hypothetical protein EVAR_57083_1 [Eumeta japonica]